MRRTAFLLLTALALGCNSAEPPEEKTGQAQLAAESLTSPSRPNAIRLLEQATFGPKLADIDHVAPPVGTGVGISGFITEQLAKPAGVYTGWNADNNAVPPIVARDVAQDVFEHAISGDDQLRQRVTLALSQIFVTSLIVINDQAVMADYLSMLRRDAFGNFRTLLNDVTLHPMMGRYLNMANNVAYDTATPPNLIAPDENYAREVMQLFTMGLDELYDDGTVQLDCTGDGVADPPATCTVATGGKRIPTYTQDHVENLAHALTGWTYYRVVNGVVKCPAVGARNNVNYTQPMIPCDVNHDPAAKEILKGKSTTQGGTAQAHLTQALDFLFNDNSTPPYICKQLIQHLVTANPTPQYVSRVVAKFKNNGSGVRGDLAAVVRAILQDDEARGPVPVFAQQATYGHLRSPILLITNAIRWLNGSSTKGATLNSYSNKMGQNIGRAPSVFSFYPPGFQLPDGSGLLGPEFAIVSSATSLERVNFLNTLFFGTVSGTTLDWTVVPDDPALMLQWVDDNIFHDTMSPQMKSVILDAITNASVPAAKRKALALYLAMTSSDYQTEK